MGIDRATIEALFEAGIRLIAGVDCPGGQMDVFLEPDDVELFLRDRDEWFARKNGVLKSQYRDWVSTDGQPRCGAKTKKGGRCKNFVSGAIQRPLDVWLQEDGGFCHAHGGLSGKDAQQR